MRGRKAAKGQTDEAAFDQVFDPKPADCPIVGAEIWNPRSRIIPGPLPSIPTVGSLGSQAALVKFRASDRQNDPIALPITQVGKLVERLILDVQTPIANLMHIGADPPEDLPVVGRARNGSHGNLPPLGHRTPNPERKNAHVLSIFSRPAWNPSMSLAWPRCRGGCILFDSAAKGQSSERKPFSLDDSAIVRGNS